MATAIKGDPPHCRAEAHNRLTDDGEGTPKKSLAAAWNVPPETDQPWPVNSLVSRARRPLRLTLASSYGRIIVPLPEFSLAGPVFS
jgi:hypothetical protein